jgi:iron complex outermembrane receptor protein
LLLSVQPLCSFAVFADGNRQHYSIGAGPLDAALSRFGAQAGISMAGSSALTAGKSTQGLQGDFSTEAGLTQLLLGSGLGFERQDDGSLLLVPVNSDVMELAPTAISGTAYDTSLGRNDGLVASRTMSANKTDTSIMETPQSISVVTRKQMDGGGQW